MIRRNGDLLLEDEAAREARERRASLYRAALALAAMSVLLVWLLLDDDQAAPVGAATMPSLAVPELSAMPAATVKPMMSPSSVEPAPANPVEVTTMMAQDHRTEETRAASLPQAVAPSGAATPAELASAGEVQVNPPIAATDPVSDRPPAQSVAQPDAGAPASTPVAGVIDGYRIQLGQFDDIDPATALRDMLLRHGYSARLQVRVAAGPYAQRKAAESALTGLRGQHGLGGLIVAPPSGKGYIVQLGVFAERGNADELSGRLKTWGHAAQLHARVVVGPYPDRKSAQAALQRLKRERGTDGVVIVPST